MEAPGTLLRFVPLTSQEGVYRVIVQGRSGGCNRFLSASPECSATTVSLFNADFKEGLQRWKIEPVSEPPSPSPSPPIIISTEATGYTSGAVTAAPPSGAASCTFSLTHGDTLHEETIQPVEYPESTATFDRLNPGVTYTAIVGCVLEDGSLVSSSPQDLVIPGDKDAPSASYAPAPPCLGFGEVVSGDGKCVCGTNFVPDGTGGCLCPQDKDFVVDGDGKCVCDTNFVPDGTGGCRCPNEKGAVLDGDGNCVALQDSCCGCCNEGLFPEQTIVPTCPGSDIIIETILTATGGQTQWIGEYNVLQLQESQTYTVTASLNYVYVTISSAETEECVAFGQGSVTFTAPFSGLFRAGYKQALDNCDFVQVYANLDTLIWYGATMDTSWSC